MAAARKSFMVYFDLEDQTEDLTNEELGELFRAMMAFASRGEVKEKFDSPAVKSAFGFVKVTLREDKLKFERKCETNRRNGAKGGRPVVKECLPFDEETLL